MSDKREIDDLSVEELEQLLYTKRRTKRQNRLRRLKAEGRVVEIDETPDRDAQKSKDEKPDIDLPEVDLLESEADRPGTAAEEHSADVIIEFDTASHAYEEEDQGHSVLKWRPFANRFLLIVEVVAVFGLLILAILL